MAAWALCSGGNGGSTDADESLGIRWLMGLDRVWGAGLATFPEENLDADLRDGTSRG